MFVPQACGCENQITFVHRTFFTLHGGKAAFAFHHKSDGTGCVPMVGGDFARQDQLHAHIDVGCGHQFRKSMAGIAEHQDAALGFFDGCEFTRAHELGPDIFVVPHKSLRGTSGFSARQQAAQLGPQRRDRQSRHVGNVVGRKIFQSTEGV